MPGLIALCCGTVDFVMEAFLNIVSFVRLLFSLNYQLISLIIQAIGGVYRGIAMLCGALCNTVNVTLMYIQDLMYAGAYAVHYSAKAVAAGCVGLFALALNALEYGFIGVEKLSSAIARFTGLFARSAYNMDFMVLISDCIHTVMSFIWLAFDKVWGVVMNAIYIVTLPLVVSYNLVKFFFDAVYYLCSETWSMITASVEFVTSIPTKSASLLPNVGFGALLPLILVAVFVFLVIGAFVASYFFNLNGVGVINIIQHVNGILHPAPVQHDDWWLNRRNGTVHIDDNSDVETVDSSDTEADDDIQALPGDFRIANVIRPHNRTLTPDREAAAASARIVPPQRSSATPPTELRKRLEEEREQRLCVVCRDHPRSILLMPCRHMCLCTECARNIVGAWLGVVGRGNCPLCRAGITSSITVYT